MPNLAVNYQRPARGLSTLVAERISKWGVPARASEYVTGYKSAENFSGHNPDSNGIVHGVDIFVGPGNLTEAQGIELAEAVRLEGIRGNKPGHPKRARYVIHRGRIAGDHTDWEWVTYDGPDGHWDHVHISSYDLYWGDPLPASYGPADYDSTLTWSLGKITGQGSKPTPIQEDDMPTLKEIFDHPIQRKGGRGGTTTLAQTLAYLDSNLDDVPAKVWAQPVNRGGKKIAAIQELADVKTKVMGLEPVVATIAAQTDPAVIADAIPDDIAAQVMAALAAKLGSK